MYYSMYYKDTFCYNYLYCGQGYGFLSESY